MGRLRSAATECEIRSQYRTLESFQVFAAYAGVDQAPFIGQTLSCSPELNPGGLISGEHYSPTKRIITCSEVYE